MMKNKSNSYNELEGNAWIQFSRLWYDFGIEQSRVTHNDNPEIERRTEARIYIIRFMSFWIAFTGFMARKYGNETVKCKDKYGNVIYDENGNEIFRHLHEKERIEKFIKEYFGKLQAFDPLDNEFAEEFLNKPPKESNLNEYYPKIKKYIDIRDNRKQEYGPNAKKDGLSAVLKSIYCVRNNLFHAEKNFDKRNINLVKASANILEKMMSLIFRY